MKLFDQYMDEISALCASHHVSELYVFGSVAKNKSTKKSDLDLLVKFSGVEPLEYFDNYMDLKERLSNLFSKDVDLIEVQTLKNPILKKSIDRDKIQLYGRKNSKMAV